MIKTISSLAAASIALALLGSCAQEASESGASAEATPAPASTAKITVDSPMTLSNNSLFPLTGENQYLRVSMVEGKYYEDWNPGAYMGTIWEGKYVIKLADESGKVMAETDLSGIYKEALLFASSFDLQFEDYNDDGDWDFTIGQYASSNGYNFKLFTLRKDGKVEELPIKDYPYVFISNQTDRYSTKLTKIDATTFSKVGYDNSTGTYIEDVFRWSGDEFVHVESREPQQDAPAG